MSQKEFKSCKFIRSLPFDFGIQLPNKKWCLIEVQGRQHFEAVELFGGKVGLKERQRNDNIKNKFAYDNHYELIALDYSTNTIRSNVELIFESILDDCLIPLLQ